MIPRHHLVPIHGLSGAAPGIGLEVSEPDPAWPRHYDDLAARIRDALGWRALQLEHVGSTSVPGLPAKPVIDIDLTVADPDREERYLRPLERIGFRLVIREPWWYGHRALRASEPSCNLHVFGFDSPELVRHRIFRDWLRGNPAERDLYAATKRQAASEANAHWRARHAVQRPQAADRPGDLPPGVRGRRSARGVTSSAGTVVQQRQRAQRQLTLEFEHALRRACGPANSEPDLLVGPFETAEDANEWIARQPFQPSRYAVPMSLTAPQDHEP